jgi:hypothetical protein
MDLMDTAQLLGNFGEFVGAIAVVITLIYLAIQVRHSSQTVETNSQLLRVDANATTFQLEFDFDRLLISDQEIWDLWLRGCAQEELNRSEILRWQRLASARITMARAGYQQCLHSGIAVGRFPDKLGREIAQVPGLQETWQRFGSPTLRADFLPDTEFFEAVDKAIERHQSS